jgi:6-phosphogluconolactonase
MSRYLIASRGEDAGHGLVLLTIDETSSSFETLATVDQLSSLALHPTLPIVYGTAGRSTPGRVLSWGLTAGGARLLADVSAGPDELEPCHVAVDPQGRFIGVANYTSSEIVLWPLSEAGVIEGDPTRVRLTGSGPDGERQEAAHPHQIHLTDNGASCRMHVVDLGADVIRVMDVTFTGREIDAVDAVESHRVPAGTGPRHLVFLPDGRVAISGELASTLVVGVLGADSWQVVPSTARQGPARSRTSRNYPGDLQRSPDGDYLYLANRGYDTIAVFDVRDREPVLVAEVDPGVAWPQHLLVGDGTLLVAGWDSSQIAVSAVERGVPGPPALVDVPHPGWITAVPQLFRPTRLA